MEKKSSNPDPILKIRIITVHHYIAHDGITTNSLFQLV